MMASESFDTNSNSNSNLPMPMQMFVILNDDEDSCDPNANSSVNVATMPETDLNLKQFVDYDDNDPTNVDGDNVVNVANTVQYHDKKPCTSSAIDLTTLPVHPEENWDMELCEELNASFEEDTYEHKSDDNDSEANLLMLVEQHPGTLNAEYLQNAQEAVAATSDDGPMTFAQDDLGAHPENQVIVMDGSSLMDDGYHNPDDADDDGFGDDNDGAARIPWEWAEDVYNGEGSDIDSDNDDAEIGDPPNRADQVFNMDDPDRPIYEGSNVTQAQSILSLIALIIRHGLTNTCVEDLLDYINLLCPQAVPSTRYYLYKNLSVDAENCRVHIICETCGTYVGVYREMNNETPCPSTHCQQIVCKENSITKGHYFLYLSIESQLKELLARFQQNLLKKSTELMSENLTGPLNGRVMRGLYESQEITDSDITMIWNCDGAPLFRSSKRSVWPIQLTVNEISSRNDNKILAGLWIGKEKPDNHNFLKPFVDEMVILGDEGFVWGNPEQHSRAFALCCTTDSCARPFLRQAHQFNGEFGCDWCLQKGTDIPRGRGHCRIYPLEPGTTLRTDDNFYEDAIAGTDANPSHGVKGVSELYFMPTFSMVKGFVPDLLHSVDFGVVRALFSLWFDSSNHEENFYIGRQVANVNAKMARLTPPSEISRLPRSICERRFWKASEFHAFLMYYSLIVLTGILPPQYTAHLYLLVFAMHILTQESVALRDIAQAENALYKFAQDFPRLYARQNCTFNLHQLLHIPKAVRDWGPLHIFSTYQFESNMGEIVALVRGTKCVSRQICRSFLYKRYLPRLLNEHFRNADHGFELLLKRLLCSGHYVRKKNVQVDNVKVYGAPLKRMLDNDELFALYHFLGINDERERRMYDFYRAAAVSSLYITSALSSHTRHDDTVVMNREGSRFMVMSFAVGKFTCGCPAIVCDCEREILAFIKNLDIDMEPTYRARPPYVNTFLMSATLSDVVSCLPPSEFRRKCFVCKISARPRYAIAPITNTKQSD